MSDVKPPLDFEVLRLLPAGHIQNLSGGEYLTRANWTISRCWQQDGNLVCGVKVSLRGQVYTATVPEADVHSIEISDDGVVVHVHRASHAGR